MIRVGLTGGIGSGKSTIAKFFNDLGIPVYQSDIRAKVLMESMPYLIEKITELFGKAAYSHGVLNRKFLSEQVFSNPEKLEALNKLVHPVVREDFRVWSEQQNAPYVIQEAAILFETGGNRTLDFTILVTAPQIDREQRVMMRDALSREAVQARIQNQWPDSQKIPLADFIIKNACLSEARNQVIQIHRQLLNRIGTASDSLC